MRMLDQKVPVIFQIQARANKADRGQQAVRETAVVIILEKQLGNEIQVGKFSYKNQKAEISRISPPLIAQPDLCSLGKQQKSPETGKGMCDGRYHGVTRNVRSVPGRL